VIGRTAQIGLRKLVAGIASYPMPESTFGREHFYLHLIPEFEPSPNDPLPPGAADCKGHPADEWGGSSTKRQNDPARGTERGQAMPIGASHTYHFTRLITSPRSECRWTLPMPTHQARIHQQGQGHPSQACVSSSGCLGGSSVRLRVSGNHIELPPLRSPEQATCLRAGSDC